MPPSSATFGVTNTLPTSHVIIVNVAGLVVAIESKPALLSFKPLPVVIVLPALFVNVYVEPMFLYAEVFVSKFSIFSAPTSSAILLLSVVYHSETVQFASFGLRTNSA